MHLINLVFRVGLHSNVLSLDVNIPYVKGAWLYVPTIFVKDLNSCCYYLVLVDGGYLNALLPMDLFLLTTTLYLGVISRYIYGILGLAVLSGGFLHL
jgi:hypothetical protein